MNTDSKLIRVVKKCVWNDATRKVWFLLPDKLWVRMMYFAKLKRLPNLKNPIDFNEKIIWWKLHNRDAFTTVCADKYRVREVVRARGGDAILNDLYGVYENVENIPWDELPDQFVLKVAHGSQMNIICKDKSKLDIEEAKRKLQRWQKVNYFKYGREWQYKYIPRRIICEKYLEEDNGDEVVDYRFFCFQGEPKLMLYDMDKYSDYRRNIYDMDFQLLDLRLYWPNIDSSHQIEKPENFEEMKEIARKLSEGFPQVRIDLYTCNHRIYFGEMTFCHSGGGQRFEPEWYNQEIGSWFHLDC